MKIRAITYFCNPGWPIQDETMHKSADFIAVARPLYTSSGYEVQTSRLATIPYPYIIGNGDENQVVHLAQAIEAIALASGFEYISLGPALPEHRWSYPVAPQVIGATEHVFLAGMMVNGANQVDLTAISACARIIGQVKMLSPDGFANLRFAALANVAAGGPFFPGGYHQGEKPAFALAIEAADLAVEAFASARNLHEGREFLITSIERHATALTKISRNLEIMTGAGFAGLDFSLAPFPESDHSLGKAMELLGVPAVGLHGSLAAAAILTDTLDRARFLRVGYNGLFLPVLEDAILAERAAEGILTVKDLLLYATVCGTGLDTVPLPGEVGEDELTAVLLDVATLSQRLKKPLTARLMPIPGKRAGDRIDFDFTFFASSRVMTVHARPLTGFLGQDDVFSLQRRA